MLSINLSVVIQLYEYIPIYFSISNDFYTDVSICIHKSLYLPQSTHIHKSIYLSIYLVEIYLTKYFYNIFGPLIHINIKHEM